MIEKKRIESLDWLRGIMAFSIMIFHIKSWSASYVIDSKNILDRLGIYSVSIFFILSGLSIAIAYQNYSWDIKHITAFIIKRASRLLPLLWVCILLVVLPDLIFSNKEYDITQLFLNAFLLLSIIPIKSFINVGAWSINNEMVFYLLTPLLIMAYKKNKIIGNILVFCTFLFSIQFAFMIIDDTSALTSQWQHYISPLNNLFLYCSGVAIFYNFKKISYSKKWNIVLLGSLIYLFTVLPAQGDLITIVVENTRLTLMGISIAIVGATYKFNAYENIPQFISKLLKKLGEISYGIYMFHPIAHKYVNFILREVELNFVILKAVVTMLITLVISMLSYHYLESKIIKYGSDFTRKLIMIKNKRKSL
jgi:exopolysaccharide production protein ExoZ